MIPGFRRLGLGSLLVGLILTAGPTSGGDEAASRATETPGLRSTQVSIAIDRDGSRRLFRATVLTKKDDTLTILTAAHCLSDADENGPARLILDGALLDGTVRSVVRNPAYRTGNNREVPGPDNAVARLQFGTGTRPVLEALEAVRPIEAVSARSFPAPGGQTVAVRMIDGHGVEHAVRAGNYSNPRWLEWGPAYKPIPGDSGGGVFVLRNRLEGSAQPVLVGIIVGRDDRGGGASLVSLDQKWLAEAILR